MKSMRLQKKGSISFRDKEHDLNGSIRKHVASYQCEKHKADDYQAEGTACLITASVFVCASVRNSCGSRLRYVGLYSSSETHPLYPIS